MSNLKDRLKKLKDKINKCESIKNLEELESQFSSLKTKVYLIRKPKQRAPLNKLIAEIEPILLKKQEELNPAPEPDAPAINEERQKHMTAFLRELTVITKELSGLKRAKVNIENLNQREKNHLNGVQDQLQAELEQNVDSALSALTNCAFQYLTNEFDLPEFKAKASSIIETLKLQINGAVINPGVKLKALEATVINAPKDPARQEQLASFRSQIFDMHRKAFMLGQEGHTKASTAATLLCNQLTKIASEYEENRIPLSTLKLFSKDFINKAHEELDKHRGWKRALQNFALIVGTLGIGYVIGALAKRSFFALNPKTDSAKQVNDMENEIDQMMI